MKKNLCILLLIGLCAIPLISKADSKRLLSKIPADYESTMCVCVVDIKQINPFLQVMGEMIESSSLPPEGKAEFKGLQGEWVKFLTSLKDYGITPDDFGAICAIAHTETGSDKSSSSSYNSEQTMEELMKSSSWLSLIETTVAEDVFLKYLRGQFDTTEELIDGHKVFVCKGKDAKKPSAAESPATEPLNQKTQNTDDKAPITFEYKYKSLANLSRIVTFLDNQTILITDKKETLKDYFAKIKGGIQPARFPHQDDLSKNPALWICGNVPFQVKMENPEKLAAMDKMDRNFHETVFCKLDKGSLSAFINTENEKSVSVDVFLKMTDDTAAPMFSSLISGFLTVLSMSSDNPAAIAELIKVKAAAKEVAVTLKINKMLVDTVGKFTAFGKAVENLKEGADLENKGLTITHEK